MLDVSAHCRCILRVNCHLVGLVGVTCASSLHHPGKARAVMIRLVINIIIDIINIAFSSLTSKLTWRVQENSFRQERRECWENFDLPNLPRPPPPPLQSSWAKVFFWAHRFFDIDDQHHQDHNFLCFDVGSTSPSLESVIAGLRSLATSILAGTRISI